MRLSVPVLNWQSPQISVQVSLALSMGFSVLPAVKANLLCLPSGYVALLWKIPFPKAWCAGGSISTERTAPKPLRRLL